MKRGKKWNMLEPTCCVMHWHQGGALIDSGTSLLTFPRSASHITEALKRKVGCLDAFSGAWPTIGAIVSILGAVVFSVIHHHDHTYEISWESSHCCGHQTLEQDHKILSFSLGIQEYRSKTHVLEVKSDCSNLDELPTLYFELDGAEATCTWRQPFLMFTARRADSRWSQMIPLEVVLPPRAYIFKAMWRMWRMWPVFPRSFCVAKSSVLRGHREWFSCVPRGFHEGGQGQTVRHLMTSRMPERCTS